MIDFNCVDVEFVLEAKEFAIMCHDGQFRKDGVTPYIEHPKQVVK